ncbi:hypothetical protein C8R44DRAFT_889061 [Mycena epipterygia]|nr:hypothetical protein C8R44DRAFT_889061 [Mycena epipterygia]
MVFSKSAPCPPQTVRALARLNMKIPEGRKAPRTQPLAFWRRAPPARPTLGYRPTQSAPPEGLPTLRRLPIGRGRTETSVLHHIPAAAKPSLYETRRAPSTDPQSAPWPAAFVYLPRLAAELAAEPHPNKPVTKEGKAPIADAGKVRRQGAAHREGLAPGGTRRAGVPVFYDDVRSLLRDAQGQEELLEEVLSGRVIGGRYGRVKILPPPADRIDASPAWMTTLF